MTANQIAYWTLQEQKRNNIANLSEVNRSHIADETERNRHNLATEGIDLSKLAETQRAAKAQEHLSQQQIDEAKRHNLSTEGETARHNQVTESNDLSKTAETVRSNLASEQIKRDANAITKTLGLLSNEVAKTNANSNTINALANRVKALAQSDYWTDYISHLNTQDAQQWAKLNNDFEIAMEQIEAGQSNATKSAAGSAISGLLSALGRIAQSFILGG